MVIQLSSIIYGFCNDDQDGVRSKLAFFFSFFSVFLFLRPFFFHFFPFLLPPSATMAKMKGGKGKGKGRSGMCQECGLKRASFAQRNGEKPKRCGGCKLKWDINVVSKKCPCGVIPCFGRPGGKAERCAGCAVAGDVNVKDKMCVKCNKKQPSFGPEGG